MSDAISGVGTEFKRGDGASNEVFTTIAEVNSITGPGMTRSFIDVTSLDSTGGWREFITSFRDGGTIALSMNYTLSGYNDMLEDFENDSSVNYQLVLPDTGSTTLEFAAYVTDLPLTIPTDDKITMNVTMKISGQVTLTT